MLGRLGHDGENAAARLVVGGHPFFGEGALHLAALGVPGAAHEAEGRGAHEQVRGQVEVAGLGHVHHDGNGAHLFQEGRGALRHGVAAEADDHFGAGAGAVAAEVVVVVDDQRVVHRAQAGERVGQKGEVAAARPGDDLLGLGQGGAGALAHQHQRRALVPHILKGGHGGRRQLARGPQQRTDRRQRGGGIGIGRLGPLAPRRRQNARAHFEAVAGAAQGRLHIGPFEIGLQRRLEGEVQVHGAGRVRRRARGHLQVRVVVQSHRIQRGQVRIGLRVARDRRRLVGCARNQRGRRPQSRQTGLAGRLTGEGDVAIAAAGQRHGAEGPHVAAVGLQLVGGLRRAQALQLRGPVAGKHDKRHPRRFRLNDRRIVVRQRRARRAHKRHRAPRRLRHAQPQKRRAALVDVHEHPQRVGAAAGQLESRHGQGRRTRPGAHHHIAHAPARKLVEKRRYEQRRILLGSSCCHECFLSRKCCPHHTAKHPVSAPSREQSILTPGQDGRISPTNDDGPSGR